MPWLLVFGGGAVVCLALALFDADGRVGWGVAAFALAYGHRQQLRSRQARGPGSGDARLRRIADEAELDRILSEGDLCLYKHSTACPTSSVAIRHVRAFAGAHPEIPVYRIDVLEERDLSDRVAERLDIVHHSPQFLVVRDGHVTSNLAHGGIQVAALERHAIRP